MENQQPSIGKKVMSFFFEIAQVLVLAFSIFLFVYLLIMQPHKIQGDSMEPNFHENEYLLTDKLSYRFGEPQRGDVVVFKAPPNYRDEYIKRIMAIPGDTVEIINDQLFINKEPVNESFLPVETVTNPGQFLTEEKAVTIPQNSYFVLGDNRSHSLDSRSFGFVSRDKITGKAWFVYWPPQNFGVIEAADINN